MAEKNPESDSGCTAEASVCAVSVWCGVVWCDLNLNTCMFIDCGTEACLHTPQADVHHDALNADRFSFYSYSL